MKKLLRLSLCALLMLCLLSGTALAESCKYYSPDSPCDVIWWVDTQVRLHCRACRNHVEIKEDMNSYVTLTSWQSCSPDDGGECTICGWDYIRSNTGSGSWDDVDEDGMKGYLFNALMETLEMGKSLFDIAINTMDDTMFVGYSDAVKENLDALGMPIPESMVAPTEYSFEFEGGTKIYPYTGKAITPATLVQSEYGPCKFLTEYQLMEIGEVRYENNVNPGTATVSVEFCFIGMEPVYETFSAEFTITAAGGGSGSGSDFTWPLPAKTTLKLPASTQVVDVQSFAGSKAQAFAQEHGYTFRGLPE